MNRHLRCKPGSSWKKGNNEPDWYQHSKGSNLPHPWLPPMVMSLNADWNNGEYILRNSSLDIMIKTGWCQLTNGLRKPTVLLPTESRASFSKVIIDPTTGDDAEVPNTSSNSPSMPNNAIRNLISLIHNYLTYRQYSWRYRRLWIQLIIN